MLTIAEIKKEFELLSPEAVPAFVERYQGDGRGGVQKLLMLADKKLKDLEAEKQRMYEMYHYERLYPEKKVIAGIDEVGRGPLAGPVVTCCCVLPKNCDILYLNDSKQLKEKKREELYEILTEKCTYSVGMKDHTVIDEINILQATFAAMRKAIEGLSVVPDQLLVDAVTIPEVKIDQRGIIKGDAKSASIAAASIIAKVTRDRMMVEYDRLYPGYGFAKNKGYGSPDHIKALKELGPCPIHRRSFIKNFI